jgi:hypothetical protein
MTSVRRGQPCRNPTTAQGLAVRRGMTVLWRNENGDFLLTKIVESLLEIEEHDRRIKAAMIHFPNGVVMVVPIDELHELPRHESSSRRRGRW